MTDVQLEPADQYLKSFHWNKVKYRADKPLGELIDMLQKVRGSGSDSSVGDALILECSGNHKYRQRC